VSAAADTFLPFFVEQGGVYSIYYMDTLLLPEGRVGCLVDGREEKRSGCIAW
jgi:hypothetical protein